jgi:hypothetical protein
LAPGQGALFRVEPGDQRLLKRGERKGHGSIDSDKEIVKKNKANTHKLLKKEGLLF